MHCMICKSLRSVNYNVFSHAPILQKTVWGVGGGGGSLKSEASGGAAGSSQNGRHLPCQKEIVSSMSVLFFIS